MQITALAGDVERILQFTHGGNSLGFDRTFGVFNRVAPPEKW
jgi:hypothetical protein